MHKKNTSLYLSLGGLFVAIVLFLIVFTLKGRLPGIYRVGPAGEEAFFQLKTQTVTVPQGADILVKALLNTCANTTCASVSSADLNFKYDPAKLQSRSVDGSTTSTDLQWGSLFNNQYPTSGQIDATAGSAYVAGYNTCATSPTQPTCTIPTFNSSGKSEDQMTFAKARFKALSSSGSTTITVEGTDVTSDWTNVYSLTAPTIDLLNQSKAPGGNGNLVINFTAPNPATMSLQTANSSPEVGKQYTINLVLNTANIKTSGVDALINFEEGKIEINNVDWHNLTPNFSEYPVMERINGQIKIRGLSTPATNNFPSGTFTAAVITYTPLQTGLTDMTIVFNQPGQTANDSNVSFYSEATTMTPIDLLGSVNNLTLNIVEADNEQQVCETAGGTWKQFPNGCADRCNAGTVCTQVLTMGCDCLLGCWNGTSCVNTTPTPTPPLNSVELKIKFMGVSSHPTDDSNRAVRIWATSDDGGDPIGSKASPQTVSFSVDDQGIYHGYLLLGNATTAHHYRLRVKGPKHLQEVFDNRLLTAGTDLDLTSTLLRAGDVDQNGMVDINDLNQVGDHFWQTGSEDIAIGDLNFDNIVNSIDRALILKTFEVIHDQE